jgi:hypothetical protein
VALKKITKKSKNKTKPKRFDIDDARKFIARIKKELRMVGIIPGASTQPKK